VKVHGCIGNDQLESAVGFRCPKCLRCFGCEVDDGALGDDFDLNNSATQFGHLESTPPVLRFQLKTNSFVSK
jgi:hypothetical protein